MRTVTSRRGKSLRRGAAAAVPAVGLVLLVAGSPSAEPVQLLSFDSRGTVISAIVRPAPRQLDRYRALLPSPYSMPRRPLIAFSMIRLDPLPGQPVGVPGYMEGAVGLRAAYDGREGWFNLSMPVNNSLQFVGGRAVGLPKEMADVTLLARGRTRIARATADGRLLQELSWKPLHDIAARHRPADALLSWTEQRDPYFTVVPPLSGSNPLEVRYNVGPRAGAPPLPEPRLGSVRVRQATSGRAWHGLVPRRARVPGMFLSADVHITVEAQALPMLAGSGRPRRGDWAMWQRNRVGSRFNPFERTLTPRNVGDLQLKWAFPFPAADQAASSQPAVVDGTVYVGGRDGVFYAIDARTGVEAWRFDTYPVTGLPRTERNPLRNGPAVANGRVYFGDGRGRFYALDARTGELLWVRQLDANEWSVITSSPLLQRGRIYVGVSSREEEPAALPTYPCCRFRGSLVSLDARSGRILWRHYTVPEPKPDGTNGSGTPRFAPSGVAVWASPALDRAGRTVFVGTGNNYTGTEGQADSILALDARTGRLRWQRALTDPDEWNGGCVFPSPLGNCPRPGPDFDFGASPNVFRVGGRTLVGEGQKSGVYHVLDARTGKIVWQAELTRAGGTGGPGEQTGIQWGSAYDGRRIYVATSKARPGTLFALSPRTGRALWRTENPADGCTTGGAASYQPSYECALSMGTAVSATPGLVFEGSQDGKMRIFDARSGRILWQYDTVRQFTSPTGVSGRGGSIGHGGSTVSGGMLFVNSGYNLEGLPFTGMRGSVLLAFGLP